MGSGQGKVPFSASSIQGAVHWSWSMRLIGRPQAEKACPRMAASTGAKETAGDRILDGSDTLWMSIS